MKDRVGFKQNRFIVGVSDVRVGFGKEMIRRDPSTPVFCAGGTRVRCW